MLRLSKQGFPVDLFRALGGYLGEGQLSFFLNTDDHFIDCSLAHSTRMRRRQKTSQRPAQNDFFNVSRLLCTQ